MMYFDLANESIRRPGYNGDVVESFIRNNPEKIAAWKAIEKAASKMVKRYPEAATIAYTSTWGVNSKEEYRRRFFINLALESRKMNAEQYGSILETIQKKEPERLALFESISQKYRH